MADRMSDAATLLAQIEDACRRLKVAQSTFGRLAVNDGKFVTRLQQGGRVTLQTVERVHRFIADQGGPSAFALRSALGGAPIAGSSLARTYDRRQKYLTFVGTTSEKRQIADRALQQLSHAQPRPPAIRLFDANAGEGSSLARLLRGAHRRYPWLPFYVVAREVDAANVGLLLEKMVDRFQEHPQTMLVVTNLAHADAPWLKPASATGASAMAWHEAPLDGATAGEFEEQIARLRPFFDRHWQVRDSGGHARAHAPAVLVVYRRDHKFTLDQVLPRPGLAHADYDFILLSHPYRARASLGFKAGTIVAPLARALRPSGRLLGVHGYGDDPGLAIIQSIWPDEDPFVDRRGALLDAVRTSLGPEARHYDFQPLSNEESLFRFHLHALPGAPGAAADIGMSTRLAAWHAASYVAQIDDRRLAQAMADDQYLGATADILSMHGGLWFNDESYVFSRRSELG